MMDRNKIAILSSLGPPWGGVGMHISRLLYRLKAAGIPYVMYDQLGKTISSMNVVASDRSLKGLIKFIFSVKEDIIHLHTSNLYGLLFLAAILKMRGKKIISTFHNQNVVRIFNSKGLIIKSTIKMLLPNIDHIICVNNNIYSYMISMKVRPNKLSLIPAFLPPSDAEISESNLSKEVLSFMEAHQPIIGSHGWFGYFVNNVHVYSFDMITELIRKVVAIYPKVGFYTVITDTYDNDHRNKIIKERKINGLEENWLIIEQPSLNAVALFKKSDLFLRPTITDGDSVSIRECLYLGIPVIASDCVPRPDACIVFKSRDQVHFEESVLRTIADLPNAKKKTLEFPMPDDSDKIMKVYYNLMTA